ncbi:MAG: alpha/beta hydrolase [Bacteroidota bacterium]
MNISEWKSTGQKFNYRGHSIFFQTAGKGDGLLLVHGFPTASWDWVKMWPNLIDKYKVLAPDMVGFGFSDKPTNYNYSLHDQADLMEKLLEDQRLNECHILAHDYGDTVVQELLARQNEGSLSFKIKSVCLLNGGLFPGVHKPRLIQNLLMTPLGGVLKNFVGKNQLKRSFKAIFGPDTQATEQELEEFWSLIDHNNGKGVIHKLIWYMKERETYQKRWLSGLVDTQVPLRLIDGAFDPISGQHLADHYNRVIPNPDVILLENIGHYPQVEAPKEVSRYYFDFLNKVN